MNNNLQPQDKSTAALVNAPKIPGFEMIRLLGEGGMSRVYAARQTILDRLVAVKVLSSERLTTSNAIERFQKESTLMSRLDHPNITKTYGCGVCDNGQPYIVFELLDGISLTEEFKNSAPLKFGRFREIFLPVLSGLDYAHKNGVVHRDIKPSNIMICKSPDGKESVKILDFGIAKALTDDGLDRNQRFTQTGMLLGSPNYMSPEQCQDKQVDGRSDIYSLACVMYEALAGELPFSGGSAAEVMLQHITGEMAKTADLSKSLEVPKSLAKTILWGLAKNPADRPPAANVMHERLSQVLDDITLDRAPRSLSAARVNNRNSLPLIATTTLFALGAGGLLFNLHRISQSANNNVPSVIAKGSGNIALEIRQSMSGNFSHVYYLVTSNMERIKREENKNVKVEILANGSRACMVLGKNCKQSNPEKAKNYFELSIQMANLGMKAELFEDQGLYAQLIDSKIESMCELGKKSEAKLYTEQLTKSKCAQFPEIRKQIGECLNLVGDFEEAERFLSKPIPNESYAQSYILKAVLASTYQHENKTDRAIELTKKIGHDLILDKGIQPALRAQIWQYLQSTMSNIAPHEFEKLVLQDLQANESIWGLDYFSKGQAFKCLGEVYGDTGNLSGAESNLKDAVKYMQIDRPKSLSPVFNSVLQELITVLHSEHKDAEAKKYEDAIASSLKAAKRP